MAWTDRLRFDPLPPLLDGGNAAVRFFAERDLLGADVGDARCVRELPAAAAVFKGQEGDGGWKATGANARRFPAVDYRLIETWKHFRILVDQYAFDRSDPATARAAEFLFSRQTEEGDIRGILAGQLTLYYTGAILGLLTEAGYADDPRVDAGLRWLLDMRQDDGGWVGAVFQTLGLSGSEVRSLTSTAAATLRDHDRAKPFSHNWTGMVLRAFAAHPGHRRSPEARHAARLLASRFFEADRYSSYRHPDNWLRFQFPFWWNHLVAALDSVTRIGLGRDEPKVEEALAWLAEHQEESGLWRTSYSRIHKAPPPDHARVREEQLWISLAICRIFTRTDG